MRHTDDESAANSSCCEFPEFLQNVGRRSFLSSIALSRAHFMAVHEVLAGEKTVATALADLQTELIQSTGLNTPAPGESRGRKRVGYFARHATQIRRASGNEVNMTLGGI